MIIQATKQAVKTLVTAVFAIAILASATLAEAGIIEPAPAAANTPASNTTDSAPDNATEDTCNGSTAEEYECIIVRYVVVRDELDKTYQSVRAKLAKDIKSSNKEARQTAIEIDKRLEKSQRAWALFRDSDCQLESAELIGSNREELSLYSCQLERTQDRIKLLKELAF